MHSSTCTIICLVHYFFTIFITMKTIDIIFNDEDYYDEFVSDLTDWCEWQSIPTDKVITGMMEDNVDDIDYFVVTVNQTLFSYLMWKEYDMSLRYGSDGWNRHIKSNYNCEIT